MIDGKTIAAVAAAGAVVTGAGVVGTDAGREGLQKFTGGIEQAIHGAAGETGKDAIEKRVLDPGVIVIDNRPLTDYYSEGHRHMEKSPHADDCLAGAENKKSDFAGCAPAVTAAGGNQSSLIRSRPSKHENHTADDHVTRSVD